MKDRRPWLVLLALALSALSGYLGCATMVATELYKESGPDYKSVVLTDEIIAIGKPDPAMAKTLERDHFIAFIGKKQSYLLFEGGQELWQMAQLKLDPDRLDIDAAESQELFLGNDRVWGSLWVRYDGSQPLTPEEQAELAKAGFSSDRNGRDYRKSVRISGQVIPPIEIPDGPMLKKPRVINFYTSTPLGGTMVGKIVKAPLILVGVAIDTALLPLYVIALATAALSP